MIMTKEQSLLKARQLMAQLEQLVESSAADSRRRSSSTLIWTLPGLRARERLCAPRPTHGHDGR